MTIKNAKSETSTATKPVLTTAVTPETVEKPSSRKPKEFNNKAHVEARRVLKEAIDWGDLKDGADAIIMQFLRTVEYRLRPYAKVVYED